jgi:hypothetical protein
MATNPGDSLNPLDQGSLLQFQQVYLGPPLGHQLLPVAAQMFITSTAPLVLGAYSSRIILQAIPASISLPSVAEWMVPPPSVPNTNLAGVDRSIWIKDLTGSDTCFGFTEWRGFDRRAAQLFDHRAV